MPEKEHSGTFENSKLFPENQPQMQHSNLLMVPSIRTKKLCKGLLRRIGCQTRGKGHYFQNGLTVLIYKLCANQD
jgi:hypothetical protein